MTIAKYIYIMNKVNLQGKTSSSLSIIFLNFHYLIHSLKDLYKKFSEKNWNKGKLIQLESKFDISNLFSVINYNGKKHNN